MLSALGDRGDTGALPVFVKAAKDNEAEVRIAAVRGLGKLGNESTVTLLAETAAKDAPEQAAARESLYRLRGGGMLGSNCCGSSHEAGHGFEKSAPREIQSEAHS